jgi:hypothetical protein
VVGKARLRYRSLLLTTNFKVALQVESTILHFKSWTRCHRSAMANKKFEMKNGKSSFI